MGVWRKVFQRGEHGGGAISRCAELYDKELILGTVISCGVAFVLETTYLGWC